MKELKTSWRTFKTKVLLSRNATLQVFASILVKFFASFTLHIESILEKKKLFPCVVPRYLGLPVLRKYFMKKKSCIRETKHLSTAADSSTDTTVELTKNTQKPKYFEKWKKAFKQKKLKNV